MKKKFLMNLLNLLINFSNNILTNKKKPTISGFFILKKQQYMKKDLKV